LARLAYREAIAQLENAVRLCRKMGGDGRWRGREQGLHLKLGQALIANQGYQAPATLRTFKRALRLADDMADVSLQLPALFGLWAGHHIAGTCSADLAERYAALAETQSEAGPRLVGLRMLGLERFYEGRFAEALALTNRALEIYDPVVHRDLTQRFGPDPRAAAANYKAWSLWHLGFPDQATSVIRENLRWIREVDHANTWDGPCRSKGRPPASRRSRAGCARPGEPAPAASSRSTSASRPRRTPARTGTTRPGAASSRR
jgi:tetratricopeptide (TPR) repeat protein